MKKIILSFSLIIFSLFFANAFPADSVVTASASSFNVDSATQHYLNMLSPEQKANSDSYFEGGYLLQLWNLIYGFGVAFVFLRLGLGKWMKRFASKVKRVNLQNLIHIVLYILLSWALSFPFSVYQDHIREH